MQKSLVRNALVIFCLLGFNQCYSQFAFGLKGGLNLSRTVDKTDSSSWDASDAKLSVHVGAFGEIQMSEKITLGAELLMSDKGFRKGHVVYANIPLYASFNLVKRLSVHVGPEVGVMITTFGDNRESLSNLFSRFDLGAIAGLRYKLTERVGVSIRFEQGLANVIARNATSSSYRYGAGDGDPIIVGNNLRDSAIIRNQNLQVSVSYNL